MTKKKIYILIILLVVAYLPLMFIITAYRDSIILTVSFFICMCVYFAALLYGARLDNLITEDHFKEIEELKEERDRLREEWRKAHQFIQVIGEHEAIKMWNENKNKENEQSISVDA